MNDQCVCIDGDDGDLPEFSVEAVVTARKDHVCIECKAPIPKGARYERVVGKWDDKVQTIKTCLLCAEVRGAFCCGTWTYSMFWEDVEEQMFAEVGLTSACLDQLTTVEAKQFLSRRWWAWVERNQR